MLGSTKFLKRTDQTNVLIRNYCSDVTTSPQVESNKEIAGSQIS